MLLAIKSVLNNEIEKVKLKITLKHVKAVDGKFKYINIELLNIKVKFKCRK